MAQLVRWFGRGRRMAASRLMGVFVLSVFFLVAFLWTAHIRSFYAIARGHPDETHTIYPGYKRLNPFGDPIGNFHVGETTRWFARLLYPAGLYYMNSRLGGGAREKHSGYYLAQHHGGWGNHVHTVSKDSGVQDYVFGMRIAGHWQFLPGIVVPSPPCQPGGRSHLWRVSCDLSIGCLLGACPDTAIAWQITRRSPE